MVITGRVRIDYKTKNLAKRIQPHEIAVINHLDLDELAALSLVRARVKAVINCQPSISGKYPNLGPLTLLENDIPLLDSVNSSVMTLTEGQLIEIRGEGVYCGELLYAKGVRQTKEAVLAAMDSSKTNMQQSLESFLDNTLFYAHHERDIILGDLKIPQLDTSFAGKQALIVVRGKSYCEDLKAVKSYISEMRPVLIGVDGGADILVEYGYKPDLIIGDMDSISDDALSCGAEILVHAYTDGAAPGLERTRKLELEAKIFSVPGTSEDAAMLLAYHAGAELIVAVGTHSNMIDFLEKGRKGMASTLLTRLKVGSILVDAKGVSKLYGKPLGLRPVFQLVMAAVFPLVIIITASSLLSQLGRLLILKFRLLLRI